MVILEMRLSGGSSRVGPGLDSLFKEVVSFLKEDSVNLVAITYRKSEFM